MIKEHTEDNFNKTTYHITLKLTFKDNPIRSLGYRYHYALSKLLKESLLFAPITDTSLITEMTYTQNPRGDEREPSKAEFKIQFTRFTP